MKGFFLGLVKLILGVTLALLLLSLAGVAAARYFMARLSVVPPKPEFQNDAPPQPTPAPTPTPEPTPSTAIAAEATAEEEASIPPGSYEAVVIQPIGLVLRAGPGIEFERIGGVDYNETVRVLKRSEDDRWLNVKLPSSGQEGWVKAGNTRPLGSQ